MAAHFGTIFQLWQNTVRQLFAQLNAPLVKGEDVQDRALSEDFVLVQGNQRTQAERRDFAQQDGVRWTITFEHFERHNVLKRSRIFTLVAIFLLNHVTRLAECQRFGLREEVRQQLRVVIRQRVVSDGRGDEIARHHFGTLVDQLVERMLAVSARLTPDDWASLVIHRIAVTVNVFTVGFHVALLEVGRETVHILVIRQNRFGFSTEEVVVPDTDQRQQHRQVFLSRGGGEVFVHRVRAREQLNKVVEAYGQDDGQTNCRPQGVTTANPVPELKHIGSINTELANRFTVGRQRCKVFGYVLVVASGRQEPVARAVGVGHGFLGGEGFGSDQEQRGFRVHFFQHFGNVRTIDVRHKVHIQVIFVRTQRFSHHERAEVRAADTDVHDISNGFAGIAFPAAGDNRFREGFHLFQHRVHFRHHIFAVNDDWRIATVAQRHVQYGTVFSAVDFLTGEHGLDSTGQIGFFCQILQFSQRFFSDAVFGEIHQHQIVKRRGKLSETIAIFREQIRDSNVFHFFKVFL